MQYILQRVVQSVFAHWVQSENFASANAFHWPAKCHTQASGERDMILQRAFNPNLWTNSEEKASRVMRTWACVSSQRPDQEIEICTTEATSTLSQRKGRAPQPSITFSFLAGGGGPPRRHVHDSIRPIRLTVALGLKARLTKGITGRQPAIYSETEVKPEAQKNRKWNRRVGGGGGTKRNRGG